MKYIKLGYLLFLKNLKLNFIVIFEIIAMILVGVNMISLVSIGVQASVLVQPLTSSKFVYYMSTENYLDIINMDSSHDDKKNNSENPDIENVKFRTRIFITDASCISKDDSPVKVYAYNKSLIDFLKIPLKDGEWYAEQTENNSVIDAVSTSNKLFEVGDIVVLKLHTQNLKPKEIKVRIIGVLDDPAYLPNTQHISQSAFSLTLFSDVSYNKIGEPTILINSEDIVDIENTFLNATKSEFIVFNDDITNEEYQDNIRNLSENGLVATSDDIKQNDKEWVVSLLKENLPMIIFLFVISIIGLLSISIINMANYVKTFSIYFICGATLKDCYKVVISYLLIMFLWVGLLGLFLTVILANIDVSFFSLIEINRFTAIWSFGVIALYFGLSVFWPMVVFKRSTLKEALSKL